MIFEHSDQARIFGVPPGADFPVALVSGLIKKTKNLPPENLARVELFVNTRRMQRRVMSLLQSGGPRLLPKIRLVTELSQQYEPSLSSQPVSQLRRRFELINLISALLDKEPELAPRTALFDLADSLALLLDEMNDEKVTIADIAALDVSDRSGHWERSQKFLKIIGEFSMLDTDCIPDANARQRIVIDALAQRWAMKTPEHPIIIAGSTGSRGSTAKLMAMVANLPQGAVVLPGYDFDLPQDVWENLKDPKISEVHPQYRLGKVSQNVGIGNHQVLPWNGDVTPPVPDRNRLISLAMRPAPVTNQWMLEGPNLQNIGPATENMTLIEAPSVRTEAMTIALIMREAAENNQTAALVTPDKVLSRRVRAALDRWRIEPDISAGDPLDTTAPGRLFRHVADMFGRPMSGEDLLILLKHPLVNFSGSERRQHLTWTRELELFLRRSGPAFPNGSDFDKWTESREYPPEQISWLNWILNVLERLSTVGEQPMSDHIKTHLEICCALAAGPDDVSAEYLWDAPAGIEMQRVVSEILLEATIVGKLRPRDYGNLFLAVLRRYEVRDPVRPHPDIMIWGTLEARVQGADLVILGGLNENTWPQAPSPDPWLNREMRHAVGLLLPERQIGLSAHDFQQAVAAKNVVLSRSVRDDEAPSVPSRWLSRITNLMEGISTESAQALENMRERGQDWLRQLAALETPKQQKPEPRPAPAPPVGTRPKSLPVTAITRLIRDPYAIYARNILKLFVLDPLRRQPDARLRGIALHRVLEKFIGDDVSPIDIVSSRLKLMEITDQVFAADVPWADAQILWKSRFEKIMDKFLSDEIDRRNRGKPFLLEAKGSFWIPDLDFTLTAIADRIDMTPDGRYIVYDYKSGKIPTAPEMEHFEKQLMLEAMMLEFGAFKGAHRATVDEVAHIGLGSDPGFKRHTLDPDTTKKIRGEFYEFISQFGNPDQGYSSRRAVANLRFAGDYDHLARFGEWDDSQVPTVTRVGI